MNKSFVHDKKIDCQRRNLFGMAAEIKVLSCAWLTTVIVLIILAISIFIWLEGYTRKSNFEESLVLDKGMIKVFTLPTEMNIDSNTWENALFKKRNVFYVMIRKHRAIELLVLQVLAIEHVQGTHINLPSRSMPLWAREYRSPYTTNSL